MPKRLTMVGYVVCFRCTHFAIDRERSNRREKQKQSNRREKKENTHMEHPPFVCYSLKVSQRVSLLQAHDHREILLKGERSSGTVDASQSTA